MTIMLDELLGCSREFFVRIVTLLSLSKVPFFSTPPSGPKLLLSSFIPRLKFLFQSSIISIEFTLCLIKLNSRSCFNFNFARTGTQFVVDQKMLENSCVALQLAPALTGIKNIEVAISKLFPSYPSRDSVRICWDNSMKYHHQSFKRRGLTPFCLFAILIFKRDKKWCASWKCGYGY